MGLESGDEIHSQGVVKVLTYNVMPRGTPRPSLILRSTRYQGEVRDSNGISQEEKRFADHMQEMLHKGFLSSPYVLSELNSTRNIIIASALVIIGNLVCW